MLNNRSAFVAKLLAVAIVGVSLAACSNTPPTVIATTGDYPPFNLVDDAGEIVGLERDIGDELCQRANLTCEWIVSDWDTLITDVMADEFDVILAGMSITDRREEWIDFTNSYYPPAPSAYLAKVGVGDGALNGTLGANQNTIYSEYFISQGLPFVALDGAMDAVDPLLSGEVDAVLVDHGYAISQLAEHEGKIEIVGPAVQIDRGLGIGVRKSGTLRSELDAALASMKADGTLNTLILNWVGEGAATFPRP